MYTSALFVTLFAAVAVHGLPTGAPNESCESMMPGHDASPQNSPPPYEIILDKPNLKGGQSVQVTIKGKNGETFRGYLIEARAGDDDIIGKFSVPAGTGRTIDCGGDENAVTHSNPSDKKEITVTWTAPKEFKGKIVFYVTIVKVFDTFWVKEKSTPVTIS